MDIHQFFLGNSFDAYTYFGAHVHENGVTFRTLAPNSFGVELIWEGNNWMPLPMQKVHDGGVFEITLPIAKPGEMYKYRIYSPDPTIPPVDHCDPYGFGMELRPDSASIIRDLSTYTFHDEAWLKQQGDHKHQPMNIYEMHLGSWKSNPDEEHGWYTYKEMAELLIPYLKKYGYNYVEFMPLSEHPADCSWGYQNTGFYAPTSRYGTAEELMELIDQLHQNGIGALLDFVPVHFAVDGYALKNYDGTTLYEYPEKEDNYSEWGSCNFIHARGEVCSFLQSNVDYWVSHYHFDGVRMDAVSRLIYWGGNEYRGTNPASIHFLKRMNSGLHARHNNIILIAEDSTNYGGVTRPTESGGLGFDYKWDMGWMHDTLDYFKTCPMVRRDNYHKLTFSMMYFPNEYYLLPLSHDENVHGKATVAQKMHGDYEEKFPQARLLYMYMIAHPGKKLNFMGSEFAQLREWTEEQEQDWCVLQYPLHDSFHKYMEMLNHLYLTEPALYRDDYESNGFRWIDCHQESRSIYAIERSAGDERIVALFHMTNEGPQNYNFTLPNCVALEPLLNSQWNIFSGTEPVEQEIIKGDATREGTQFTVSLPSFGGALYRVLTEQDLLQKKEKAATKK